jgi:hypothetical protein
MGWDGMGGCPIRKAPTLYVHILVHISFPDWPFAHPSCTILGNDAHHYPHLGAAHAHFGSCYAWFRL